MEGSQPTQRPDKLTVAQILTGNAGSYVKRLGHQAAPQVQSTLAKLSLCRTAALGGRSYRCGGCDHQVIVANSCGDRYCPTCGGARRRDWLESASSLVIDGVDHFQVVFTLPSELSRLALGNRKEIYDLLFASSWTALKQTIEDEHGYDAAALMVLHTWNQKLDAHAHIHAVVPGCGPALDGSGLRWAQRDGDLATRGSYLVDAESLRTNFRDAFLKSLGRLHAKGELKLTGEFEAFNSASTWQTFTDALKQTTWVSFIQPPPRPGQTAEHVLKYLARYLSGGPISDSRIVSTDEQSVTFMARAGIEAGGNEKQIPIRLTQVEFVRRWCLHVLPSGYTRSRRFGGWSNTRRRKYIDSVTEQLSASDDVVSAVAPQESSQSVQNDDQQSPAVEPCPRCGSALILHRHQMKPSWSQVMASPARPVWYRRL